MSYKCQDCGHGINFNHQGCKMTTENKTNDDLKPCPFCGGDAEYFKYYNADNVADKFRVSCNSCGAMKDAFKSTPENAASSWNTRADLHNDGVCRDHFPASPDSARCLEELTTLQGQTFWNTNEALHAWAEWSNKNAVVIRDALQSRADHFVDVNKMVPDGYVLVPLEPETKHLKAMAMCQPDAPWLDVYKALIAAAQGGGGDNVAD